MIVDSKDWLGLEAPDVSRWLMVIDDEVRSAQISLELFLASAALMTAAPAESHHYWHALRHAKSFVYAVRRFHRFLLALRKVRALATETVELIDRQLAANEAFFAAYRKVRNTVDKYEDDFKRHPNWAAVGLGYSGTTYPIASGVTWSIAVVGGGQAEISEAAFAILLSVRVAMIGSIKKWFTRAQPVPGA